MPEALDIFALRCAIFFLADISPKEHISRKFSRVRANTREQVASLASRHEQSTVRAAFFFLGANEWRDPIHHKQQ
jgi:hypothetical protein